MRSGRGWSAGVGCLARSETESVKLQILRGLGQQGRRKTGVHRSDRIVQAGIELADETVLVDEVQRCFVVTMHRRGGLPGEQKEGDQAQSRSFPGECLANPFH